MRAYIFPGQGVQKRGMGQGVLERFPELCRQADEVLGYSIEELCRDDPGRLLSTTEYAQPAIYVVNALHYMMVARPGFPAADYLAGHSLGEYGALFAAGVFDFATGLTVVKRRAELMGAAETGGMAAVVGVSAAVVEETLRTHGSAVVIANYNAPEQLVLSGSKDELARLGPVFDAMDAVRGIVPLRVDGAFHSPLMEAAAERFRGFLESIEFDEIQTPVVSSVHGRPFASGGPAMRHALAEQITRPVRWDRCVRHLRILGVSDFVELGGNTVLTSLIDKITSADAVLPWCEYHDERVLALLRACSDGDISTDEVVDTIRASSLYP